MARHISSEILVLNPQSEIRNPQLKETYVQIDASFKDTPRDGNGRES